MPLLDHFHPPLQPRYPWESLFSGCTTRIADALNDRWPPSEFIAVEYTRAGTDLELGVSTPDSFEVHICSTTTGLPLLGAVMLVGPYNKHLRLKRRAFATKCAGFLRQGVRVVIIDIVTSHLANLHNEIMALVPGTVSWRFPAEAELYAVAYRPVLREERAEIDLWPATCALGAPLPTLPLRLTGDRFVPVDFETTYQETCRRRRIG